MIGAISAILVILLVIPTYEQDVPKSPCPSVFEYEPAGSEPGRWYGVINIYTDSTLFSLWLNIVLDSKADLLGNWLGLVTTSDNTDFKVENTQMKIQPDKPESVRFFVQYNPLNKIPRLHSIRLNGREICNADRPAPTNDTPDTILNKPESTAVVAERPKTERTVESQTVRPRPNFIEPQTIRPVIKKEDRPNTRPVFGRPAEEGPVYVQTPPPYEESAVNLYSINGGQSQVQSVTPHQDFQLATRRTTTTVDDYYDENRKPSRNDFFPGGGLVFIVPGSSGASNSGSGIRLNRPQEVECGKVLKPNPLVINGVRTLPGQWPWQVALYQAQQTVDSKYICGGTLVTEQHVITVAHCVTHRGSKTVVHKNTLLVYLGKHNLRTSVEGVQIQLVSQIIVHPEYNPSLFAKDLAILKLREAVFFSEYVRPACLWPENLINLNSVIGSIGSVVGWGFDDKGSATEELTLVTMPVVDQETCIRSYSGFFARFTSNYTYCAGYRDGTSVCNGDSGGGMVFNIDGSWYLRGLVSLTVARSNENRCDPSHFVVFTDIAKLLPWIQDQLRY